MFSTEIFLYKLILLESYWVVIVKIFSYA